MRRTDTSEAAPSQRHRKPKKSVALSGVAAGNTALCTVGRTGNDLHYRGYDILDFADACEFEEIAYLLVHGKLPDRAELAALQGQAARRCAACPPTSRRCSSSCPPSAHPMDVMRTGVLGAGRAAAREGRPQPSPARATSPTG